MLYPEEKYKNTNRYADSDQKSVSAPPPQDQPVNDYIQPYNYDPTGYPGNTMAQFSNPQKNYHASMFSRIPYNYVCIYPYCPKVM